MDTDIEFDLATSVRFGLRWSAVNQLTMRLGTLVSGVLLARILLPEDFGVFAVVLLVATVLLEINEMGVKNAIVRSSGPPDDLVPTANTLTLLSSVGLYAVAFVTAPVVADIANVPSATSLIRVLSLVIVVDAMSAVPAALLARSFRQDKRALADGMGLLISIVVTVVSALAGEGAWSFVWGRLAGNAVAGSTIVAVAGCGPRLGWDGRVARRLGVFTTPLAFAALIGVVLVNLDAVVIARELGVVALGFYVIAFNVSSLPVNLLSTVARRVAVPAFSHGIEGSPEVVSRLSQALRIAALASGAVSCLLVAVGEPLVRLIYGARWDASTTALVCLAAVGGLRVMVGLARDFLIARNRPADVLKLEIVWLTALVPTLIAAVQTGAIAAVALAHVFVIVLLVCPLACVLVSRTASTDWRAIVRPVTRPTVGAAVGGGAGWLVSESIARSGGSDIVQLLSSLVVSMVVFTTVGLDRFGRRRVRETIESLWTRRSGLASVR